MHKYHNRLPKESHPESQSHPLEDFNAITARLRIKDMAGRKNVCQGVYMIDDKYHLYTQGTLANQEEDLLRFWDVRSLFINFWCYTTNANKSM